ERDRVDRRPAPDPPDVVARPRALPGERVGLAVEDRDRAPERVRRVRDPEGAPRVPTRALERHPVPPRPERLVDDAIAPAPVDRDERVDPRATLAEEDRKSTRLNSSHVKISYA